MGAPNFIFLNGRYQEVVAKTKRLLLRSTLSVNGIRNLSRFLHISDDCGGTCITRLDFEEALKASQISLSNEDVGTIFEMLDGEKCNAIDPAEFVASLRYQMSPVRRAWLRRVWNSFCKDSAGNVLIAELQSRFCAAHHPDVVCHVRLTDAVVEEFQATFNEVTNPDGVISPQEFEEYYAGVSAAYFDDAGFVALLRSVWPMQGTHGPFTPSLALGEGHFYPAFLARQTLPEKQQAAENMKRRGEMMRIIMDEHRPAIMAGDGLALRLLGAALRAADESGNMFLSVDTFVNVLRSRRLYVSSTDVLSVLDTSGDGSVDCIYYLELLVPEIPAARRLMLERLWRQVFSHKDSQCRVNIKEFQAEFVPANPIEKNNFLNAWDVRVAVQGKVQMSELIEWYTPISSKISVDKDFEKLLARQWPRYASSP